MSTRTVPLGELFNLVNGDPYKPTDWSLTGAPIIRIKNLNNPSKPYNYWAGPVSGRVTVKQGDLLLAWSGTPGTSLGAHVWWGGDAVLNQHIFRLDAISDSVDPDWAHITLNHRIHVL